MLFRFLIMVISSYFTRISFSHLTESGHPIQEIGECPYGTFPCNSTEMCVEQRMNCDGKQDCKDGSDEWHCEDHNRKMYWNTLFRKRPDEDREKRVKGCELGKFPSDCRCSSTNLFCDNLGLKRPPDNLPENVMELDLSGNRFHILEPNHFPKREKLHVLQFTRLQGENLPTLELFMYESYCVAFDRIMRCIAASCLTVKNILTSSEVTFVLKDAFENLPSLTRLYLTGNRISVIVNGTLSRNVNLTFLTLSHNPLSVLTPGAFQGLQNLKELDLSHCDLETLPVGVFDDLVNLEILMLDRNRLNQLQKGLFCFLSNLELLSLSRNEIKAIDIPMWTGLQNLRTLSISENVLENLDFNSFGNMSGLLNLDLHGNKLRRIDKEAFQHFANLDSLDLRMNELRKPSEAVFDSLTSLSHIYFDDFHFCSLAMHVRVCKPQGDGISSIAHLLDSVVLRVSVWLVAVLAFVGNVAVLVGRFFLAEPNEVHSFYIKNLSLADLIMAVYLFTIAAHDIIFRGEYILHEARWRHSWQCNLCGFLSTLSSESSILILTIITIDRYLSIIHPLSTKKRTIISAAGAMGISWAIAILLSLLPILNIDYYGDEFYRNNGVCLPLHIHNPFGQAWEYSTFLFCGVNFSAFLFILFAYLRMFFTISNSKIGLRCTQQQQDRNIAKRFAFIVGTDFLCWVPIVFIKVIAMAGVPIQEDLYAWVAVFLLPLNSAINPILYTLTTKLFKQHIAKIVYNFKTSTGNSGESVPSFGRNSLRDNQRNSMSLQGEHHNFTLMSGRNCLDCRNLAKKNSLEVSCRHGHRISGRRKDFSNAL